MTASTINKVLLIIITSIVPLLLVSQKKITIGETHRVYSEILEEHRNVIVGLPQDYLPESKKYSVVVVLDGDYHFVSTYGTVEYLSKRFLIPETIVVAIPNTNRVKDLTPTNTLISFDGEKDQSLSESGGGSTFLRFLEEELLPWLHNNYATNGIEVLIGHSWGGLLVTDRFLDKGLKKNRFGFEKYLAIDPSYWWDDQYIIQKLNGINSLSFLSTDKLFMSASSLQIEKESGKCCKHRNSIDLFYHLLKKSPIDLNQFTLRYFEDEDHASVPVPSTYYGLKVLFEDYVIENYNHKTLEDIISHYHNYYSKHQEDIMISENLLRNIGEYNLYAAGKKEEALSFFRYNYELYPSSQKAYESLQGAYQYLKMDEAAAKLRERNTKK